MGSFDKGKAFEQKVAAMIRRKLDAGAKRDSRSGANWHRRSDIYTNLPLHLEVKDHEAIKPKEWFRQAANAASFNQTPVVVFHDDEEVMALVRFDDLLNLFVEIADYRAEVEDLGQPTSRIAEETKQPPPRFPKTAAEVGEDLKRVAGKQNYTCPNGHIGDIYGKCMQKTCKFGRGYKAKKESKK